MRYIPSLDKNFKPMINVLNDFKERVSKVKSSLVTICLERHQGYNYIYNIDVFKDGTGHDEENYFIVERIIKSLLWIVGGFKVYIKGSKYIYEKIIIISEFSKSVRLFIN